MNNNFPPNIIGFDLNLSDICNLTCDFCYTKGGCKKAYSEERVQKTFEWFFKQYQIGQTNRAHVTFYGGEPLIEFEHIKHIVQEQSQIAKSKNINMVFSIVTNMTLADEEKILWCKQNRVGIHPSIDGCEEAQNMYRKFKNGEGSANIVYKNAKILLREMPGRSCRMTVGPQTVQYTAKSIKFVCEELGFRTVNAILAGGVLWTDSQLEIFKEQITDVTNWWLDQMRQNKHYSLYHIRNMLDGMRRGTRRKKLCPSGTSRVGIDSDGNLWPCHRFCNYRTDTRFKLGTIYEGYTNQQVFEQINNYDLYEANKEKCKNCRAQISCHALCMHESLEAYGELFRFTDHYCKVWPFYWDMACVVKDIMVKEKNQLFKKLYIDPPPPPAQIYTCRNCKNFEPKKLNKLF